MKARFTELFSWTNASSPDLEGRLQGLLLDDELGLLLSGRDSNMVLDEFVYDPKTSAGNISAALLKGNVPVCLRKNQTGLGITRQAFTHRGGLPGNPGHRLRNDCASGRFGTNPALFGATGNHAPRWRLVAYPAERNASTFALNSGQMVTFAADGKFGRPVAIAPAAQTERKPSEMETLQ